MPEKLFALLLLAAAPAAFHAGAADADRTIPITGKASGLRFSGHYDDEAGRRRWLAEADTANSGDKPGEWRLERIRITTFDKKTGKPGLVIVAPAATYTEKDNAASDPGPVVMDGDDGALRLSGRDWRWADASESRFTVAIRDAVRVVLTPVSRPGRRSLSPTVITADRLDAINARDGRRLTFTGNVRVESKDNAGHDAVMTCDNLVVNLPRADDAAGPAARADAFDSIEAAGNVRLADNGAVIAGRRGLVVPGPAGKSLYTISGDALFTADGNDLRVNGESMRFDSATRRIEVDPPDGAADGRVTAEFRAVDASRARPSLPAGRARASGRKLSILVGDNVGTLLFSGDVKLDDPDYSGTCDRLAVDFAFDRTKRIPTLNADPDAIRRVVAEGAVSLTRNDPGHTGRTVTAGRAEIFPGRDRARTVLTGKPRAYDPENGLVLEAAKVTLENGGRDTDTDRILAESDATSRVRAVFDASGAKNTPNALQLARISRMMVVESAILLGESAADPASPKNRIGKFRFEGGVKLDGIGVSGECDRLGLEISAPPTAGAKAAARVRHAVATGNVRLDLTRAGKGCLAKAGRAELWPEANLRELSAAANDGLDGESPLYVTLERDDASPGLRPFVSITGLASPRLVAGPDADLKNAPAGPTTVEADHQELIKGEKRLRTFARKDVAFATGGVSGTSATLEMLATEKPATNAKPAVKEDPAFTPDALIARGGVKLAIAVGKKIRNAAADTLEIYPKPDGSGLLALDGHPVVDDMITPPEVTRKTLNWKREPGPDGKPVLNGLWLDEIVKGATRQVLRPRITLPFDRAPDIAIPIKNLDNDR